MCQRALRKPHRVKRCKQRRCRGDGGLVGDALGQPVDRQQREGGDDQLSKTGGERIEAGEFPPEREIDRRKRRVRIREGAVRNQRAAAEEIVGGGDIVAGLVPVVGQVQESEVREIERNEYQRKDQPQRKGLVCLRIGGLPRGKSEEGKDCCLRGLWSVRPFRKS